MSQSPEEIRRDIERTRAELAYDVDTLQEKVSPSAVASRRVQSAKGALSGMKEKVMGTTSSAGQSMQRGAGSVGSSMSSVGSSMSSAASTVTDTASAAPQLARRQTQGNPLAAGLVAFGAGWLISSILPASEKEQRAATAAKDKASEHSETLAAPAREAAQSMTENLQPKAQEAAESMRSTASEAASTVKGEAQSAKDDLSGQARESADQVRGPASSSSSETTSLDRPVGTTSGDTSGPH